MEANPGIEAAAGALPALEAGPGRGAGLAIEAAGIVKKFGRATRVDGLDIAVREGELFALLGPNGAGKTTTIKMLSGLLLPDSGSIAIGGRDMAREPEACRRLLAVSPQETAIAPRLTVLENLSLIGRIYGLGVAEVDRRAAELVALMGLGERAEDRVGKFSGGMQRKLSIAMAMIADPEILFLDEPTLGLDPQSRRELWAYIAGLKGTKTIVLTTHYLEEADALADHILIIDKGKKRREGTSRELKESLFARKTMAIKARRLSTASQAALRALYGNLRLTAEGAEIAAADIDFDRVVDILRANDDEVEGVSMKEPSLDDVFLELTGKGERA